jgi:staphylococcal nuclease domain-containing protein 1
LKKLEQLMVEFADFHSGAGQTVTSPFSATQGSYCSAQFSQDKQWYRARVEKVVGVNNYQVLYIDYGNYENVPGSRLRPLTPQFSVAKLPAQALELGLHHVEFPSDDSEFAEDCFSELSSQLKNAKLAANIVGKKDNIQTAIIYAQTNDKTSRISSVNEKLIREGLAIVPSRMVKKFYEEKRRMMKSGHGVKVGELDHFIDAMEQAKKQRLNLWQYGDFTQDDDL